MERFNLSRWGLRHPQLLAFLIVLIAMAGGIAYLKLGRAEDPSFTIKNVAVSAVWPGATSEEMQGQVADPIERKLQELPWADKIETYSKPGFASVSFTFRDATPAREVPMLFLQLRKKMNDVKPDLPAGVSAFCLASESSTAETGTPSVASLDWLNSTKMRSPWSP